MYLEDLVKRSYIKSEPATDEEITLLLAGCRPQVDQHLVVSKSDFETVLMENRATDPTSEAILMTIGRSGISPGDPIWDVMLKRECVVSHYTRLCNNEAAEQLSALGETEEPQAVDPPSEEPVFIPASPPSSSSVGADGATSKEETETTLRGATWAPPLDGKRLATPDELSGGASTVRKPPAFEFEVLGQPEDQPEEELAPQEPSLPQEPEGDGFDNFGFGDAVGLGAVSEPAEVLKPQVAAGAIVVQSASASDGMDIYLDDPSKHQSYVPDIAPTDVVEDAPLPGTRVNSGQEGGRVSQVGQSVDDIPGVVSGDELSQSFGPGIAPQDEGSQDVPFGVSFDTPPAEGLELGTPPPAGEEPPILGFGGLPSVDEEPPMLGFGGQPPADEEPMVGSQPGGLGMGLGSALHDVVPGVVPPEVDAPMGIGFGPGFDSEFGGGTPLGLSSEPGPMSAESDGAEPPLADMSGAEGAEPPLADMSGAEGIGPMFPIMEEPPQDKGVASVADLPGTTPAPENITDVGMGHKDGPGGDEMNPQNFATFDIPDAPRPPSSTDMPKQVYDVPGYVAPAPIEEEAAERYEAPVSDGAERVRPGFIGLGPVGPDDAKDDESAPIPPIEEVPPIVLAEEAPPAEVTDGGMLEEHRATVEDNEHLKVVRNAFDLFHTLVRQYTLNVILAAENLTPESFCLQLVEEFPQFGDQYEASLSNYNGSYDRAVRDLVQSLQLEAESAVFAGDLDRAETCIAPVCKLIYD